MSAPARRLVHRLIREAGQPGLATESLSPELEAAAARRLGALALLTACAVTVLAVIGQLTRWLHVGVPRVSVAATVLSIVLSLVLYATIASGRIPARLALRLGLVYQVVQGFVSSVGYYGFALVPGVTIRGWSSAAVWMVVFPLIVPAPLGRTVVATLATAAADPLGLAFAGTPAFMPPEMALGVEAIDGRADIYALGCVAYWLLTGRRVFENPNTMQVVLDHIRTPPVPPSRRTSQAIPEKLERLVLRCLEKEPEGRPASVAELSAELETLEIEGLWTKERARQWWGDHRDAGAGVDSEKSTVLLEASSAETRSQVTR